VGLRAAADALLALLASGENVVHLKLTKDQVRDLPEIDLDDQA
jgi:hypothetical protein